MVAAQAAKSVHYKSLKQEADSNRQLYETMLQKVKEAGIATAVRATNVQLLNAAAVPESPAKPNLALYGGAGLMLGLFLGTALAFVQGSGGRRIRTPGEAGSHLGCPELGAVPYAYGGRGGWLALGDSRQLGAGENGRGDRQAHPDSELSPELASWSGSRSPMAESIQAALAGVLFSPPRGQQPRVLVVTSAAEGEGKTTIACNFALALAQMNQRVLLIDGHLRKPRLHDVFGIPNRRGFSDLLEGLGSRASQGVPEMCAPVDMAELDMNGLHVLPSGARSARLVNHLCSPELPRLFESWRGEYDFIVIDAAPLTLLESRPLALAAEGVVLVIGAGRTSQDTALASLRRLEADGANVLGIVLNDRGTGRTPARSPRALVSPAPVSSFQTT
ncbi:MAG: GNVR domain-containing protein [Bryobacterales bacterium]|nr:GNVR domain-containing protein [Bryobacterales bacterium]